MCHPLGSPQALIVSYMRKYPHLAVEKQRSGSPQMQRGRPLLEEERCFSFVLIRHSQSCWLRGWYRCEITSLIKRPVWYGHTQSWDTPQLSNPPFFVFFPTSPVWRRRRNDSCLKWQRYSLTTLTHLSRWKPISLAFEAADTVPVQHDLSAACSFEPHGGAVRETNAHNGHRAFLVWEEGLTLLYRSLSEGPDWIIDQWMRNENRNTA